MMFRGGGTIEQPKIAWRRPTFFEALQVGSFVFTVIMVMHVVVDAVVNNAIDYGQAFFRASCGGVGYFVASLIFKSRIVILR